MSWTPKTPYLTADAIVEIFDTHEKFLGIVIIERKNEPLGLALPGGFVDVGESVEAAAVREMKEEISLDVELTSLLGVYSDPSRDKRFHTASVVYVAKAYGKPIGADDAKKAILIKPQEIDLESLVFDHKKMIEDYLNR